MVQGDFVSRLVSPLTHNSNPNYPHKLLELPNTGSYSFLGLRFRVSDLGFRV